jgi:Cephalosporin hydroxylase
MTTQMVSGSVPLDEARRNIRETQRVNAEVLQQFHEVFYNATFTWGMTSFTGIGLTKAPSDLWMYQELLTIHRPQTIIETGTYQGGSAMWFAFLMDVLNIEDGRIFTVDLEDQRDIRARHPRVTFLEGNSTDPAIVKQITAHVKGPLLVSLDSDHASDHVRTELDVYGALCQVGDWLVVEDTNVAWESDGGARAGAEGYLRRHPGEWFQDILRERYLVSMHPGGWWQRVAACPHHAASRKGSHAARRRLDVPDLSEAQR